MQARKDSGEPLNRRSFDLQEAVVLLDVYLDMIKNGTSITKAAEKASVRLRSLAKRNGYVISDSYRSAGGLVNRLRSLGGLYEGQESKSAPGTPMFAEVVSLYINDRARYEEILSTEKSVASQDGQNSSEQRTAHGKVTAEEEFGAVESVKAASDLISPVSGTVEEINEDLEDNPELINEDAFKNWIIKVKLSDKSELDNLLTPEQYQNICK